MSAPNKYAWEKVVRDSEALTSKDKLVAFIMGTYANKDGWNIMVSQATMTRQARVSLSTIERAVRRLISAGFIEQTRRAVNRGPRPGPGCYRLTIPLRHWRPHSEGAVLAPPPPFYPNVENKVHPSPTTAETRMENKAHPSPVTVESGWGEDSSVIQDGLTHHPEAMDPSSEVVSPVTHDGLTVFNRTSTEEEEHSGTDVPARTPIPASRRTDPVHLPWMTPLPEPLVLDAGQPRLFLEARLGRDLTDEEDVLAAELNRAGKTPTHILSVLQSLQSRDLGFGREEVDAWGQWGS